MSGVDVLAVYGLVASLVGVVAVAVHAVASGSSRSARRRGELARAAEDEVAAGRAFVALLLCWAWPVLVVLALLAGWRGEAVARWRWERRLRRTLRTFDGLELLPWQADLLWAIRTGKRSRVGPVIVPDQAAFARLRREDFRG